MTLLSADGFEDGTMAWTLTSAAIGTGRYGNGLVLSSAAANCVTGITLTPGPIIVGFAFKPPGTGVFCGLTDPAANGLNVMLRRDAGGEITVVRSGGQTVLGTSAAGVLPVGAWSYVEVKATFSNTIGTVVVRVNGVQVLNLSGLDTIDSSSTGVTTLVLGAAVSVATTGAVFDDVYIANAVGTVNNDFLGELTVEHLRPAADDTAQWLGSDGNSTNNFDLVDEAGTYNGADYVASSTVGQRDLYTPTASARATTSPVLGVVVAAVAQKSDSGTRTVKLDVKEGSGGTVRQSVELGLPTSFGELLAVFERKGDGSQFTIADVNNLRMGMEVVT